MDRIEFFQSVDQKNRQFDSVITSFFDQFSALYNIVGQYDALKVTNMTEKNKVQFDISAIDPDNINFIFGQIKNAPDIMHLYGNIFKISTSKKSDDVISILITKK